MKSIFWIALNFIGFIILLFMFNWRGKKSEVNYVSTTSQILFKYFLWTITVYLFADVGAFIIEGKIFPGAMILHYIFTILTYVSIPFFIALYIVYCDEKTFYDHKKIKKRAFFYFLPIIFYFITVLISVFSDLFFYIDAGNIYRRGSFFWVFIVLKFSYIIAIYLMLTIKTKNKKSMPLKAENLYLYLFPIPSVILAFIQVIFYGVPVVGIGFVLSAFIWYVNGIQSPEERTSITVRSRYLNIIQFVIISFIMMTSTLLALESITKKISMNYSIQNSEYAVYNIENFLVIELIPLFVIMAVVLILFAISSNRITAILIFTPLKQLINSLLLMRKNNEQVIFGLDRKDEFGLLSNAIQDYFVKGYIDELTGVYNRRYLETTLKQIMATYSRTEYKLSVMMIDIDFFKKYNDLYGHTQGDICLKLIAARLNKLILRKGDFLARYGGEEFAVVLPHADESGARGLAEHMLQAIRDLDISHEQSNFGIVTVSIGVTTGVNIHGHNQEDYINKADEALYLSKENGRNGYTFLPLPENN